jgi:hypothetical protein
MEAFTTNPAGYIEKDRQVTKPNVYAGSCEAVVPVVRMVSCRKQKSTAKKGRDIEACAHRMG